MFKINDNYRYIIADKDNSAIGVASIDGSIEYIDYDAWGEPSYTGDIDSLNILWNGYYFDGETGNYYLRNRYYSPTERRFLTEDPHGTIPDENWNNPFGITNQYIDGVGLTVYAGFNPVNNRDDWGLLDGNAALICQQVCDDKLKSFPRESSTKACYLCCQGFALNGNADTAKKAGEICAAASSRCEKPIRKTKWKWWHKFIGWISG